MSRSKVKDYPLLEYFGSQCRPLTSAEAQAADFDTRISSIGRFLVRESLKLHRKLSPESAATYSPEDLLLEIWIELKRRNDNYDSSKGGYRTFAAQIIHHCYLGLLERARCVKLPANAAGRFKAHANEPDKLKQISKAATDHSDVNALLIQDRQPSPVDGLIWLEDEDQSSEEAAALLDRCTLIECLALGAKGLWGNPPRTLRAIGAEHDISQAEMRRAAKSAADKLKDQDRR